VSRSPNGARKPQKAGIDPIPAFLLGLFAHLFVQRQYPLLLGIDPKFPI
jgi:hypothetical protein